ncbi:MAG: DUF1810 family protein [Muribaculaceae bacterium]|nr:DUF1810 family protein [Muribaculaceae bacterium]MDE5967892.1 DUF1810 family protein [Muribaculaceae bacterium]
MIERFVQAQNDSYIRALNEIKSGRKRTHWMWFIFPQIKGIGRSITSIFFSIEDEEEAKEYLNHPVNEGGDADTNGAVACAILGAKFGYSSIPSYYIENLHNQAMYHHKIMSFINQILDEKA